MMFKVVPSRTEEPKGRPISELTPTLSDESWKKAPRERADLPNGVTIYRQGGHYLLAVGEQEIEVSELELAMVLNDNDVAFDLIVEKMRKFKFSASEDNYDVAKMNVD